MGEQNAVLTYVMPFFNMQVCQKLIESLASRVLLDSLGSLLELDLLVLQRSNRFRQRTPPLRRHSFQSESRNKVGKHSGTGCHDYNEANGQPEIHCEMISEPDKPATEGLTSSAAWG